jgi:hypothetical protein
MPGAQLQAFADKTGKSLKEVEKLWDQAKDIATKEYDKTKEDDGFYEIVTGILKKSLGIKESFIDMVDVEMIQLDEIMHEKKQKKDSDEEDEEVEDEEKNSSKKDSDEEDEEVEDEEKKKK